MLTRGLLLAGVVLLVAIAVMIYAAARERQNAPAVRLLSAQAGDRRGDGIPAGGAQAGGRQAGVPRAVRPQPFTVLTLNVRHGSSDGGSVDLQALAGLIRASGADLVALQEVDQVQLRSGLVDQPRALARALGMDHYFAPTMRRGMGRYGNLLLSRYPIMSARSVPLPSALEPRGAIIARVGVPGGELTVAATHLGLSAPERRSQAEALAAALAGERGPAVVLGDWNAEAAAPELAAITGAYREALDLAGADQRATFRAGEVLPYAGIDHVFVSDGVGVLAAEVLSEGLSDHQPVLARLILLERG